jgi:hypothetical protein
MAERHTEMMRVDKEMLEDLRWLARHEQANAANAGRKPKTAAKLLKELAGKRVRSARLKIEPWVKKVQAVMASEGER